jgi:hypothetical protein
MTERVQRLAFRTRPVTHPVHRRPLSCPVTGGKIHIGRVIMPQAPPAPTRV